MAYFNYHAKAKKLIQNGFLTDYKVVENHNGIKPALVLYFSNSKPMPIRKNKWQEYFILINKNYKEGEWTLFFIV